MMKSHLIWENLKEIHEKNTKNDLFLMAKTFSENISNEKYFFLFRKKTSLSLNPFGNFDANIQNFFICAVTFKQPFHNYTNVHHNTF